MITRIIKNTKVYVETQCGKKPRTATSTEQSTMRKSTGLISKDQLEITTLKLSLTRLGRRRKEYTRYFSCWCVEKVGGEPLIKGSGRTRI